MVETIEGIVLKNSDYHEKSKIIQVFSKEHGLIGIYLKGAANYKTNTFTIAQPISHAFFTINYRNGLSSSYKGEMINSFHSLKLDFNKNIYIYHLFELLLKTLEQHQQILYLYDILLNIIKKVAESNNETESKVLTLFFELKLLHFIGVTPVMTHCVECGSTEHIANFDISKGGFICQNCLDYNSPMFNVETLESLYYLFIQELDGLNLNLTETTLNELRLLLNEYYSYHLGVKTNSSKYFNSTP